MRIKVSIILGWMTCALSSYYECDTFKKSHLNCEVLWVALSCGLARLHMMKYSMMEFTHPYEFQYRYCRMKRKKKGGFGGEFNGASNTQVLNLHNAYNASYYRQMLFLWCWEGRS